MAVESGGGTHFIYDLPHGVIQKFQVVCVDQGLLGETESGDDVSLDAPPPDAEVSLISSGLQGNGCSGDALVWNSPVDEWANIGFGILHDIHVETDGTMQRREVLTSSGIPGARDAFDITSNGQTRVQLERYIEASVSGVSTREFAVRAFLGVTGQQSSLTLDYTVTYPDGSRVQVSCNHETESCAYVPGSALDPDGQPIFDSVSPLRPHVYWLDDGWLNRWVDNARRHGVLIMDIGSNRPLRMDCSFNAESRFVCVGRAQGPIGRSAGVPAA